MAENTQLARLGFRLGTLGTNANLAIAFPLANGNYDATAHTAPTRMGLYADRTASNERIGIIVNGYEAGSFGSAAVRALTIGAYTINAGAATVARTISLPDASGTLVLSGTAITLSALTLSGLTASQYVRTNGSSALVTVASIPWSDITGAPASYAPTLHASTHGSAGSDPITVAQSQVSGLIADLGNKANDNAVVKLTGDQTVSGTKTFTRTIVSASASAATPALSLVATAGGSSDYVIAIWDGSEGTSRRFSCDRAGDGYFAGSVRASFLQIADAISAPSASTGVARIYVDSADGDLKVVFSDGVVKTIVTD